MKTINIEIKSYSVILHYKLETIIKIEIKSYFMIFFTYFVNEIYFNFFIHFFKKKKKKYDNFGSCGKLNVKLNFLNKQLIVF